MEDNNPLNTGIAAMLRNDPYEIRLMQKPYAAAVG